MRIFNTEEIIRNENMIAKQKQLEELVIKSGNQALRSIETSFRNQILEDDLRLVRGSRPPVDTMSYDSYEQLVVQCLDPHWEGSGRKLSKKVRKLLRPFTRQEGILEKLLHTPARITAMACLMVLLGGNQVESAVGEKQAQEGNSFGYKEIYQKEHISQLVVMDAVLPDRKGLLQGVSSDARVIYVTKKEDPFTRILATLVQYGPVDSLHIFSHGASGELHFGNRKITQETLPADQLAMIGTLLKGPRDILIYGCNVGEGSGGEKFLKTLSEMTGADVAASTDATGSRDKDGDWELELVVGTINGNPISSPDYSQLLKIAVGDGSGGGGGGGNYDASTGGGGNGGNGGAGGAGGGGDDTLTGTSANDVLFGDGSGGGGGGGGSEYGGTAGLGGAGGAGGGGIDTLNGGAGNDILFGDGFDGSTGSDGGYANNGGDGGDGGYGGGGGGGGGGATYFGSSPSDYGVGGNGGIGGGGGGGGDYAAGGDSGSQGGGGGGGGYYGTGGVGVGDGNDGGDGEPEGGGGGGGGGYGSTGGSGGSGGQYSGDNAGDGGDAASGGIGANGGNGGDGGDDDSLRGGGGGGGGALGGGNGGSGGGPGGTLPGSNGANGGVTQISLADSSSSIYNAVKSKVESGYFDQLPGGIGDDVLNGEGGADDLFGMGGNDTLDGGTGDDTLRGGPGSDDLSGGTGSNTFFFEANDGVNDQDTILDWSQGDNNIITLTVDGVQIDSSQICDILNKQISDNDHRSIVHANDGNSVTITVDSLGRDLVPKDFNFESCFNWNLFLPAIVRPK